MTHTNQLIRCEECHQQIAECLEKALQPLQMEGLREHLLACEACFDFYADLLFPETESEKSPPYIGRRPVWGPLAWSPEEEERWVGELLDWIDQMEESGGLMVVKYDRSCQKSALLLLIRLRAELKQEGKTVQMLLPAAQDLLLPPGLERKEAGDDCILIFGAPLFADLIEYLATVASPNLREKRRPIVIASGIREQWGSLVIPVHHLLISWSPVSPKGEDRFSAELEAAAIGRLGRVSGEEELRRAYLSVALLDSLGAPTPTALLGRWLGKGAGELSALLARAKGLLFLVEAQRTSFICTEGEDIAGRVVEQVWAEEEKLQVACRELIRSALPPERPTLLRLFHGLLRRGQGRLARMARQLVQKEGGLQKLFEGASPAELLAWGKALQKMRQFDRARAAFEKGLELTPQNAYLLHALGQMALEQGHWREAQGYFEGALLGEPDNLHVLHALGMLWSEMGDHEAALQRFAELLSLGTENLQAIVARAVLEGKRGNFPEAQRVFERARALEEENLQVAVAWGEMEIRRKGFQKARELLEGALKRLQEPGQQGQTPPVLNALAKLEAAECGYDPKRAYRWRKWFEKSVRADEGNAITYNSWARVEAEAGDTDEADKLFRKALDCDPDNAYTHREYGKMLLNIAGKQEEGRGHQSRAQELVIERLPAKGSFDPRG